MSLTPVPNPNPRPLVTALVLNYRSPRDTIRCVEALLAQTIASELEILIIDNHSDDESIGWIRSRYQNTPDVRMIEERDNTGYGCGNNAGLTFVDSEFLLIINPDNTMPSDGMERMLLSLRNHPDAGIVGPALVHPDGTVRPSARQFPKMIDLLQKRLFPDAWQTNYAEWVRSVEKQQEVEVDWLVGACLLMRTELFRSLRGFDPRFFLFFEDIDLCRRIHLLGKKVLYLPHVRVLDRKHRLSGSSMLSLLRRKTTWIHFASALKYFWKWHGSRRSAEAQLLTTTS
ncbi:glycosyltransferase family 2 protein [Candidatus Peribacteria bacterium]|nr:glycosyltransferase family 2 protein [Candidatus Peribacteria bacterium]